MTYKPPSPEDLAHTSPLEEVWGTTRFLPKRKDIPEDFRHTLYHTVVNWMFFGGTPPEFEITALPGYETALTDGTMLKCIRAHLRSFEPKHEDKEDGVAYMMSLMVTLSNPP